MHGVYPLTKGRQLADEVLLPKLFGKSSREMTSDKTAARLIRAQKRSRECKGSHTPTVVLKCLIDSENWLAAEKETITSQAFSLLNICIILKMLLL